MKIPLNGVVKLLVFILLAVPITACDGASGSETLPPEVPPPDESNQAPEPLQEVPKPEIKPAISLQPEYTTIDADLLGQIVTFDIGYNGGIWDPVEATSPDGNISVYLEWGTVLMDVDGNPLREFSGVIDPGPTPPEDGSQLIGPAVTFSPDFADISSAMVLEFRYADYADQIDKLPGAELYLAEYIHGNGTWTKLFTELDEENKIAVTKIGHFSENYTIGFLAAVPPEEVLDPDAPKNGVDLSIEYVSVLSAGEKAQLVVKTEPNAHVLICLVLPVTGTRSARPPDRYRQADDDGRIVWEFDLSKHTSKGEGRFEFYVSTSSDEAFLKALQGTKLETINPDWGPEIRKFQQGKIEQLELNEHTTLKMYTFVVAKGL